MKFEPKIEYGVEMPPDNRHGGVRAALRCLEVGESFEFPEDKNRVVVVTASRLGGLLGRKYRVRGLRVWRLS